MAAPIATGDQYTLEQGSTLTVAGDTNVLKNDTDADGQPLTAKLLYNAGYGALNFNEDGTFTYKPYDPNWTGEDTFYYTATDGSEVSEPIAVKITVTKAAGGDTGGTGGNPAPVAAADTFDMNGAAAQGNVLENDTNAASAHILYNPSYGALDFKADGSFVYTPYDTYTGEDAFFYTVKDANGVESQPVKVTIKGEKTTTGGGDTGGGTGPDANADTITLTHTSGQNYSGSTVLANDANVEGITPTLVYNPGWGTVTFNADGTFNYVLADWATPANDFKGTDEFFYKVSETEIVKVSLTIPAATGGEEPVGEAAPVAQGDTFETVTLDGTRSFTSTTSLLANDTATNGDAMTAEKMWNPGWGSVTVNADGTFTYVLADWATAANGFEGKDEFFYVAKDNDGESQVVKVVLNNITVPAVEPPPAELPTVTIANASASEADGMIKIPVTLSHASTEPVTLTYEVSAPGKSFNFDDAGNLSNTNYQGLRWENISLSSDPFVVPTGAPAAVMGTVGGGTVRAVDASANFGLTSLNLSSPYINQVGGSQQVTITGYDNGAVVGTKVVTLTNGSPVDVTFGAEFASIDAFKIDSPEVNSVDVPVVVNSVNLAGGAVTTQTVTIPANTTSGAIDIPVQNDSVYEVGEAVTVKLTGAQGATLGQTVEAVGTIANDDATPLPRISIVNAVEGRVDEGGMGIWFDVTRDSRIDEELTVQFESEVFGNFPVTFPAGSDRVRNVELNVVNDTTDSGARPYEVRIAESANYAMGEKVSVTGTVFDNDGNSPPEAYPLSFSIDENTLETEGFLFNGQGWDSQQFNLTYEIVDQPTEWGTVVLTDQDFGSGPLFNFVPHANAFANLNQGQTQQITFTYRAKDGAGGVSELATVTMSVWGANEVVTPPPGPLPVINATAAPGEVTEGGVANFTLTRSGDLSQPLTVNIDPSWGTATAGTDYTAPTTVTFAANSAEATYSVQTINDGVAETGETFEFRIAEGTGYTIGAADGNVTDLVDAAPTVLPTIAISDAQANEGTNINFRLTLSEPPAERLTVTYQVIHGTTDAGDVVAGTYTLNIAAGFVGTRGFNVATTHDTAFEPNETITVKLLSVKNAAGVDTHTITDVEGTGTVLNNDVNPNPPPTAEPGITLSKMNFAVTEGGATDSFTVVLKAPPTANVSVQVSTGNELMALGPNGSSTLVFNASNWNVPQTITLKAENDFVEDGAMTDFVYFMTTSADTRYDGMLVDEMLPVDITDAAPEPVMPYVTVANLGGNVTEGGSITFTFHRSDAGDGDLPILWKRTGTVNDADIESVTWQDGYEGFKGTSQTATVTFKLRDDAEIESAEDLGIEVMPSPTYLYDDPFTASGTVADNDTVTPPPPPPALSEISVSTANATEGGDITYTFTRTNATAALDVTYTLGGTATAADYTAPSGTVQFAAGATTATVTVKTTNDTMDEPDETVVLTLTPNAAAYTVAQGTASASILDNDEPVVTPPPATNQTITASTTASAFTGGAGIDTLVFPVIPAGSVQMLGGSTIVDSTISLGGTINGTVYNGKAISNIENLTFNDIQGPAGRTLTISGDAKDNTITVARTTKKLFINGGDGADTISYTGTGAEAQTSVIRGGTGNDKVTVTSAVIIDDTVTSGSSGNDTYELTANTARQTLKFGADNGSDTIKGFTLGDSATTDALDFGAINASNMVMKEENGNTVFTINGSQTVTVEGVTGMVFGTHWTATGTYTPPVAQPPAEPAGITISEPGGTTVTEGGATDTVTVKLNSKPTADVTIPVSHDPSITLDKQSVTFTPENWQTAQTITVTAVDDTDYEPGTDMAGIYFGAATSADPRYSGYQAEWSEATAYILDNDEAVNTAPAAWDDTQFADEDTLSFDIMPFAADAEQSTSELTYEILSQPEGGTVSILADGQTFHFEGDPAAFDHLNDGDVLPIEFTFKANDGFLDSNVATFTINVMGVTDAPAPVTTATVNPDFIL